MPHLPLELTCRRSAHQLNAGFRIETQPLALPPAAPCGTETSAICSTTRSAMPFFTNFLQHHRSWNVNDLLVSSLPDSVSRQSLALPSNALSLAAPAPPPSPRDDAPFFGPKYVETRSQRLLCRTFCLPRSCSTVQLQRATMHLLGQRRLTHPEKHCKASFR